MKDPFLETLPKIVIIKVESRNNLIMIQFWEKSDQEWSLGASFCSGLSGWDTPGHRWRHWLAPTSLTYLQVPPRWWHFQKIIPLLGTFSWTNTTVLLDFVQMRRRGCLSNLEFRRRKKVEGVEVIWTKSKRKHFFSGNRPYAKEVKKLENLSTHISVSCSHFRPLELLMNTRKYNA